MSQEKRTPSRTSDVVNRPNGDQRHGHAEWQNSPNAPKRKPNRPAKRASNDSPIWLALGALLMVGLFFAAPQIPFLAQIRAKITGQTANTIASVKGILSPGSPAPTHTAPTSIISPTVTPSVNSAVLPAGSVAITNPNASLTIASYTTKSCPFRLIMGGTAGSKRSPIREGVEDFVKQAGATAGLNGTFFANASLEGTDNLLIGPSLCDGEATLVNSPFDSRPALTGRPMVLISPTQTDLIPYQYGIESSDTQLRGFLPGLTDAFLGGVWLVHNGIAASVDDVATFNVKDAEDPRRRAFFCIMADGRPALGATTYVASSSDLAAGLQSIGVREAVLLDSGFSTSLVFQDKILVTGHTAVGIPSRPVPQALLLFGTPDPSAIQMAAALPTSIARGFTPSLSASAGGRHHHRHIPIAAPEAGIPAETDASEPPV